MRARTVLAALVAVAASLTAGTAAVASPTRTATVAVVSSGGHRVLTPPARKGTVAYNAWLGRSFNDTLLNEPRQARRIAILNQIVSPRYIQHNAIAPEGRAGLVAFIPAIYASFPDVHFTVRDVIATRTKVVTRWTWTGTLTGQPFLGVAAKGQKVEFDAIDIWTVRNGQLYEHWDQFDWPRAIAQMTDDNVLPQPFIDAAARPVDR